MDAFYAARSRSIPPLPWPTIAPPFSLGPLPTFATALRCPAAFPKLAVRKLRSNFVGQMAAMRTFLPFAARAQFILRLHGRPGGGRISDFCCAYEQKGIQGKKPSFAADVKSRLKEPHFRSLSTKIVFTDD